MWPLKLLSGSNVTRMQHDLAPDDIPTQLAVWSQNQNVKCRRSTWRRSSFTSLFLYNTWSPSPHQVWTCPISIRLSRPCHRISSSYLPKMLIPLHACLTTAIKQTTPQAVTMSINIPDGTELLLISPRNLVYQALLRLLVLSMPISNELRTMRPIKPCTLTFLGCFPFLPGILCGSSEL